MSRSHGYDDPRCEVIRARANASLTGPSGEREFHEHAFRDVELLLDILDEAQEQIDEAEHTTETVQAEADSACEEANRCAAERDSACEEANRCAAERDELREKLDAVMRVVA